MYKKSAFSMIELMVVVAVLSIGVVSVARSFLAASGALSNCENRIAAMSFLESRMAEVEEKVFNGEEDFIVTTEPVLINARDADFNSDSQEIKIGDKEDELFVNKIMLNVGWRDANKDYGEDLGTYVEIKKKE